MTPSRELRDSGLVIGIRGFALLALGAPVLWSRDVVLVAGLLSVAAIWAVVTALSFTRLPLWSVSLADAAAVAVVCGLALSEGNHLLIALAIPPFVAGLWRGARGVLEALAVEAVTLAMVDALTDVAPTAEQVTAAFSWLAAGLGFGLVASFFTRRSDPTADAPEPYREARQLMRELVHLSGQLSAGLDPTTLAGEILDGFTARVPMRQASLHVHGRTGDLVPLVLQHSDADADPSCSDALAHEAWEAQRLRRDGHDMALPLCVSGSTPVAIISGTLATGIDAEHATLPDALADVARQLQPVVVRLDTALLFAEFRDTATSAERRRLAREMHDGVAQEIASMGYLVDVMAASAPAGLDDQLRQLRSMISEVVAEVRGSVMTLRTQAGESESLGAAIASLGRHLSGVSGLPIQVTVDERTSRLRHEVEAELLRIAQEAMNNAVKHAGATSIDVSCRVDAPSAEIVVSDDGRGLGPGRADSHGLAIMRERAALIGATLDIGDGPGGGTRVCVRLGTAPRHGEAARVKMDPSTSHSGSSPTSTPR